MLNNDFINSTLVPVDFSETSLLALEHAITVANIFEDHTKVITLLHVIEGASFNSVTSAAQVETSSRDALAIEGAINRFEKIIEKYRNPHVSLRYIITGGKPYKKIVEVAQEINADLIAMGTHGSSGMQVFAGSNASRVIQTAHCPVIVVKQKPIGKGYKDIVLPLDLTRETKQKVNFAVQVARYFNATVHIVSMYETDEFLAHRLENNLKQVEHYLNERKIKTTSTLLNANGGNFAMQTLLWAESKGADLVIIMTQQERGMTEYLFGTYAQQIVNRSTIPVMTIRPKAELEGVLEGNVGTSATGF